MYLKRTKRAALHTLGCRLNQSETRILEEKLAADGYVIVPFHEAADLGVINTCTVTREADAKSRKSIRGFIRRNPEAFVAVIGCYSQVGASEIAAIDGVDLIVGNQEKLNVLDFVGDGKLKPPLIVRDRIDRDDFTIEVDGLGESTRRANLKIQDGCDFMCSFCVIPFARGRARSRDFENLLDEARMRVDRGAKEIVLTGVNIGTYANSGRRIVEVVDALDAIAGLHRIRISSIEPTTAPHALLERMRDTNHRLVPYLHIPLQSASNAVLKTMRRLYTREDYLDFIETAAGAVPDLCIGADIMVGMPGETESDFEATAALLSESPLSYAHVFKFSERKGTAATRMGDRVSAEEMNRRSATLRSISARKLRAFHERHRGRVLTVLFEHEDHGHWTGYTENYIRVALRTDAILRNCSVDVEVGESAGEFVHGHLVLDTATGS